VPAQASGPKGFQREQASRSELDDDPLDPERKAAMIQNFARLSAVLKANTKRREILAEHRRLLRTAIARTSEAETAAARLRALPREKIEERQRALADLQLKASRMVAAYDAMAAANVPGAEPGAITLPELVA